MSGLIGMAKPLAIFLMIGVALLAHHSEKKSSYDSGYSVAKGKGDLALETLRKEHKAQALERSEERLKSAKEAAKKLQEEQARADALASELADQKRKNRATVDQLAGEIARVNDLYREALDAPAKPLPACVFTAGWVRVYDEATGARTPVHASGDISRAAAQSPEAIAAEQLGSRVSQQDVLKHHVQYAEQCRNTSAQLDLLIDAVKGGTRGL
jgi:small-conductance mechanosensitive channel